MAPNLPPSITVNRNLASSIRNYVKQNGGKNVSEAQMNEILQRVAKFDAERDAGTREGGSIFDGGSKYLGGTGSDFRVKQGQVIQLSAEEFNKIFEGILNPLETKKEEKPAVELPELNKPSLTQETVIPETLEAPDGTQAMTDEAILDAVDGKVLEREVDGKKQKISVATVNGEKVRRLINEDGSLGDNLVLVSSAGKNKYITQSEMDKKISTVFPEGLPDGVSAEFVNICGEPTLVFKQDGKILDSAQLKELANKSKTEITEEPAPVEAAGVNENSAPETVGKPSSDTKSEAEIITFLSGLRSESSDNIEAKCKEFFGENFNQLMLLKDGGSFIVTLNDGTSLTVQNGLDGQRGIKFNQAQVSNTSVANTSPAQADDATASVANTSPAQADDAPYSASETQAAVMADINKLGEGEVYEFQKIKESLEFNNGALKNVNYATVYQVTKDANGNVTVKNQHNDVNVYDSRGQILSSESDSGIFDGSNHYPKPFGNIRYYNDYQNNTETMDLSGISLGQYNMNAFIDRIAGFDNSTVYDANGDILFTSTEAGRYYPQPGDDQKIYHFKDKNGKELSKSEVMDLLTNSNVSKLIRNDVFDLNFVNEYFTLEKDLFS